MKRLIEKTVFAGLVTAWRFATVPTRRSPPWVNATTDGVVRPPSAFSMTVGSPPSRTAIHEFVVPRGMPVVLLRGRWRWFSPCGVLLLASKDLSRGDADHSRSGTSSKGRMRRSPGGGRDRCGGRDAAGLRGTPGPRRAAG